MSRKFRSAGYRDPKRKPLPSPWVPVTDWYAEETRDCVKGKGTVHLPCVWCQTTSATHKLRFNGSKPIRICSDCVATLPSPLPHNCTVRPIVKGHNGA